MGFRVPTFNIQCRVWSRSAVPAGPVITANLGADRGRLDCQLRAAGKQSTGQDEPHVLVFLWMLLLPAGSDIRDWASWDGVAIDQPDLVEVPVGSERYYTVAQVDDVAKGFANEYRVAFIVKNAYWPIPAP